MRIVALLAVLAAGLVMQPARAATPIDRLPYAISQSGEYYLSGNLTWSGTSGAALMILADQVTIDLMGHSLTSTAGNTNFAYGITATGRRDVAVRNGSVTGFLFGIRLDGPGEAYVVEGVRMRALYIGIWVSGRGSIVRGNQLLGTGGSRAGSAYTRPIAIKAAGPGTVVARNTIADVTVPAWYAGAEAVGIHATGMPGGLIEHNVLTNSSREGFTVGMYVNESIGEPATYVLVRDNFFSRWTVSLAFAMTNGAYKGNTFLDAPCPVGGANLGDNGACS